MKKLLLFIAVLSHLISNAQSGNKICGTVPVENFHNKVERQSGANHFTWSQSVVDTIHVVFHILYSTPAMNIPDSIIFKQMQTLNEDYSRMNADTVNTPAPFKPLAGALPVYFALASVDSMGNPTTGILRYPTSHGPFTNSSYFDLTYTSNGGADRWNSHYMNIYSAQMPSGYTGTGFMGDNVLLVNYLEVGAKRTVTHEMGHNLGLYHIWGPESPAGPFACSSDDGITDTPPQEEPNFSCQTFPLHDACTPTGDGVMFMNFMDFSPSACVNMFTLGQIAMMENTLNTALSDLISDGSVGIETHESQISLNIFPNPNNGVFTLNHNGNTELHISIVNSLGEEVYQTGLDKNDSKQLNLNLANGIYTCIAKSGNEKIIKRIVVE